mgnify:CR=1 FL=1
MQLININVLAAQSLETGFDCMDDPFGPVVDFDEAGVVDADAKLGGNKAAVAISDSPAP